MISLRAATGLSGLILLANWLALSSAGYAGSASVASGSFSAGLLGNYAGYLSGGQAIGELQHERSDGEAAEEHDFSESASEHGAASSSYGDSLGTVGDHLDEHHFPSDYGSSDGEHGAEYAEASEHHGDLASHSESDDGHEAFHGDFHGDFDGGSYGGIHDEFHTKPVRGIDHGKGAYSYSTLYENDSEEKQHGEWE